MSGIDTPDGTPPGAKADAPDVAGHGSFHGGRQDEESAPDGQSPEAKAEQAEAPDVAGHGSFHGGRQDEESAPDGQSPEAKAEHRKQAEAADVEAHRFR